MAAKKVASKHSKHSKHKQAKNKVGPLLPVPPPKHKEKDEHSPAPPHHHHHHSAEPEAVPINPSQPPRQSMQPPKKQSTIQQLKGKMYHSLRQTLVKMIQPISEEDKQTRQKRKTLKQLTKQHYVKDGNRLQFRRPKKENCDQLGWVPPEEQPHKKKKPSKWLERLKEFSAKSDVFASAHTVPKHQMCIWVAAIMIPMSLLSITWDLLAVLVFEIPHLSMINAPAFILFINFIAMPLAMYGYMMEYLMREHSYKAIIGLVCVIVHPILFLLRTVMELTLDGYRNEMKLYYEKPQHGQPFEYPIGTFETRPT